jgi:hypothetical protein
VVINLAPITVSMAIKKHLSPLSSPFETFQGARSSNNTTKGKAADGTDE